MTQRATGLMTWTVGIALLVTSAPGASADASRPAGLRTAIELLSKGSRPAKSQPCVANVEIRP